MTSTALSEADGLSVGEVVPDTAVEHTSVEIDTLVPARLAERPLLVDNSLVGIHVGTDNILPAFLVEEGVGSVSHILEVLVRLRAVSH